jgi:formyltetrahydrofolate deformylase
VSLIRPVMTLLISCPDRSGIVAAVSEFIFEHHGNILESNQHSTNRQDCTFFMRINFGEDGSGQILNHSELATAFTPIAKRFQMKWSLYSSLQRKRAAIFVSKLDHCLIDLLWRWKSQELMMDILCIVSNHPDLEPLARMYNVPYHHFPVQRETRAEDQQRILEFLADKADFLILARYMQILDSAFVEAYPNRIINIHHSFLPAFVGAKPYHRAFERGVKLVGATAHYVTSNLDEGPIIAQDVIRCNHRDTVEDLARKGRDVERRVLAEAVRQHTEDRVLIYENKTIVFEG